jgi:hypothetical protein
MIILLIQLDKVYISCLSFYLDLANQIASRYNNSTEFEGITPGTFLVITKK